MSNWIPAVATSTLLAVAAWLARNLILTRLTKSVEHEFNARLEDLRGELRQSEERLKAELRARESELASLRQGALSALVSREVELQKRRLDAVDRIWAAVLSLGQLKTLASVLGVLNYDLAAEKARTDPKMRAFLEDFGKSFDIKKLDLLPASRSRPFVSPPVWALYSALTAVFFHVGIRWELLKSGAKATDLINDDTINKVIKAALPEHAAFLDKHGVRGHYLLIEKLEEKLLSELSSMLSGAEADKAAVERSAEIVRLANEARIGDQTESK